MPDDKAYVTDFVACLIKTFRGAFFMFTVLDTSENI